MNFLPAAQDRSLGILPAGAVSTMHAATTCRETEHKLHSVQASPSPRAWQQLSPLVSRFMIKELSKALEPVPAHLHNFCCRRAETLQLA